MSVRTVTFRHTVTLPAQAACRLATPTTRHPAPERTPPVKARP